MKKKDWKLLKENKEYEFKVEKGKSNNFLLNNFNKESKKQRLQAQIEVLPKGSPRR